MPGLIVGAAAPGCRVCGECIARGRDGNPPRRPDGQIAWSHPECEQRDEPFRYPMHMSKFAREMAGLVTTRRDCGPGWGRSASATPKLYACRCSQTMVHSWRRSLRFSLNGTVTVVHAGSSVGHGWAVLLSAAGQIPLTVDTP